MNIKNFLLVDDTLLNLLINLNYLLIMFLLLIIKYLIEIIY